MAEAQEVRGIGFDASENDGFTIHEAQQRQDGTDSGEIGFVITDERETRQRRAQESASVGVDQPLPRQRKCSVCGELGHTARTCPSVGATDRATRAPRAPAAGAISASAPILVGTINLAVTGIFGDNCGISDKESQFMVPSVQRMMERTPKVVAERMAIWIDPVVILSIFIMWGARIRQIKEMEARLKWNITPGEQARANGYVGSEYAVPNEQQTAPNGGAYTQQVSNNPITDIPPEPTSNGVPQSIRDAFDDRI